MVKIISHGGFENCDFLKNKTLQIRCGQCGCIFECNSTDFTEFVPPINNDHGGHNTIYSIDCPDCDSINIIPSFGRMVGDGYVYALPTGISYSVDSSTDTKSK